MTLSDTYLCITINIILFILGIIIGLFITKFSNNLHIQAKPKSFFNQNKEIDKDTISKMSIDDTKFVVQIKTDDLEKKYESLGDIKHSQEKISDSINKLKNLKK